MLREGIGSLLEFWDIFLPVFSSWETFAPERLVEVLNMALFVLLVRPTVPMVASCGRNSFGEYTLKLAPIIRLMCLYGTVEGTVDSEGSCAGLHL
jgi:hypothetical protein